MLKCMQFDVVSMFYGKLYTSNIQYTNAEVALNLAKEHFKVTKCKQVKRTTK